MVQGRASLNRELLELPNCKLSNIDTYLSTLNDDNFNIKLGIPLLSAKYCTLCKAANQKLVIDYNGIVHPCEVFKDGRIDHILTLTNTDNIYNSTLDNIYYNSSYINEIHNKYTKFTQQGCNSCLGQFYLNKYND